LRILLSTFALWCLVPLAFAQIDSTDSSNYVADIELETSAEFVELLQRASQLLVDGVVSQEGAAKVTFVLHGPVIEDLLRQNYIAHRELVDLAASLTALEVVDIKVCRAWMGSNGIAEADLQPFVETVSLGPGEVRRLRVEKNYVDF
jgi:intracellular sulfur oxidation DsrE/DsrF family protein